MDRRICDECVGETYLKNLIARSTQRTASCTYCGKTRPTIEVDELAELGASMVESFYESASNEDDLFSLDPPEGTPLTDLIQEEAELSDKAAHDVATAISSIWYDYDSMEHRFGPDPHFFPRHSFEEPLSDAWREMERSLRREARLVNPTVARVLEEVFGEIHDDLDVDGNKVIAETPKGATYFRARVFQTIDSMETSLGHPERNLGSPPSSSATAGRMNARGVSVFYGSTEKGVAIAEVRPPVGSHVVVGAFRTLLPLRLLDVDLLGAIAVTGSSFDPKTTEKLRRRDFLSVLTRTIVMPVMPELQEEGYLTTQAIADYLATKEALALDGMLFPSAQTDGKKGQNVILFNKSSKVLRSELRYAKGTHAQVLETDSDGTRFAPELWTHTSETLPTTFPPPWVAAEFRIEPTLELDRNLLEIFEVKGVVYNTFSHAVTNTVVSPSPRKPVPKSKHLLPKN